MMIMVTTGRTYCRWRESDTEDRWTERFMALNGDFSYLYSCIKNQIHNPPVWKWPENYFRIQ